MASEKLYNIIFNDILGKIKSNTLKAGDKLPSEFELAAEYKVSRITIRKALSILSENNLIYRIKKGGTFINGKRNDVKAQGLIPFVVPYEENVNLNLVNGAQNTALANNFFTPFFCTKNNSTIEREILTNILKMNIDGLVIYPSSRFSNIDVISQYRVANIPIVFLDRKYMGIDGPLVCSDNEQGMEEIVEHLIELGHKKIGFFAYDNIMHQTESDRFSGYCKALTKHGIAINKNFIFRIDDYHMIETKYLPKKAAEVTNDFNTKALNAYFDMQDKPTAICCTNDFVAKYLIAILNDHGVNVPEDVSITGFDDMVTDEDKKITTSSQDFFLLGKVAFEVALKQINGLATSKIYSISAHIKKGDTAIALSPLKTSTSSY